MPVYQNHYTLSTLAATQIVEPDVEPQEVWIHDAEHSASTEVFLGNSSVTALNGLHLHSAETIKFILPPNDTIWAISGSGSPTIHIMRVTQH